MTDRCKQCNEKTEKPWNFCANCGSEIPRGKLKNMLSLGMEDIFGKMVKDVQEQMFRAMNSQTENLNKEEQPKVHINHPQMKGFTIKISQGEDGQPKININEMGRPAKEKRFTSVKSNRPTPSETVEPETNLQKLPGKQIVELQLPDVKSLEDVDIVEGDESVEIRAYSGKKMYFKILQMEKDQGIQQRQFRNGQLYLEIGR